MGPHRIVLQELRLAGVITILLSTVMYSTIAVSSTLRSIDVADLVREVRFGDPNTTTYADGYQANPPAATVSPDGRKAVVIMRYGDPMRMVNVGKVLLFRSDTVLKGGSTIATFESETNNQPVGMIRWLDDSKSLLLAGARGKEPPQVFRLSVEDGNLRKLTNESNLIWYDATPTGQVLLTQNYWASSHIDSQEECHRKGCRIAADNLAYAERGWLGGTRPLTVYNTVLGGTRTVVPPEMTIKNVELCPRVPFGRLSPDGKFALIMCSLHGNKIPEWWPRVPGIQNFLSSLQKPVTSEEMYLAQEQYAFGLLTALDLSIGAARPILDVPFSSALGKVEWIEKGKRLAVAGAYFGNDRGLAGIQGEVPGLALVAVSLESGDVEQIGVLSPYSRVRDMRWNEAQFSLSVFADCRNGGRQESIYRKEFRRWHRSQSTCVNAPLRKSGGAVFFNNGIGLKVDEHFDRPSTLQRVSDSRSKPRVLLSPNSWLKSRAIGETKRVSWRLKDNRQWDGILMYPPNYQVGKRYPMLLQTHGVFPETFSLHGSSRNYPGHALASHGVLVLQVADTALGSSSHDRGAHEWITIQAAYEAAIENLVSAGIVDESRVGIIGWSRSGMYVAYVLTHSSHTFAAAAFTDTGAFGLPWYLFQSRTEQLELDTIYGDGPPFGDTLAGWLSMAPGFSLNRVKTPTLMWENGIVWGLWDWYAGLRRFNVPVDYYYLPSGAHELYDVAQRVSTNQRLVDWFRYWLKDEVDSDPSKRKQYTLWEEMRLKFSEVKAKPRPPLLQWKPTPYQQDQEIDLQSLSQ